MKAAYQTSAVLTCMLVASPTYAGGWVVYAEETAFRLSAQPSLGSTDPEEKDYAWGDVDQDGDIDLVVVRKQPYTTSGRRRNVLFMNEGGMLVDRTLQYASQANDGGQGFLDLTNDRDVALVDVNGDSWLDIVTAPACNGCPGQPKTITHPRVYINLGNDGVGNWLGFRYDERRIPTFPQSPNFCAVAAGDVTGDGAPDLYFVDYQSGLEDRLLINNGSGFFTDESAARMTPAMLSSSFGTHAVIADMNGDGWKDIVKSENGPVEIFNNDGTGNFNILDPIYNGAAYHVGVGDLNGDGRLDVVVSDDGVDRYLLNLGNGLNGMADFTVPPRFFPVSTLGFGSNSVIADLDNDGFNDVIIADVDVDISGCDRVTDILRNNPANPPTEPFNADTGGIPSSMLQGVHDVAVFDINGDCWLDLVIGRCTGTQVWINQAPDSACQPVSSADITGPGDVPDGCVDSFDLNMVLGAWCSPLSDPDPPKDVDPPCEGCVSADFLLADISGPGGVPDGCVDPFDLNTVLAAWCSTLGGNPCGTCLK